MNSEEWHRQHSFFVRYQVSRSVPQVSSAMFITRLASFFAVLTFGLFALANAVPSAEKRAEDVPTILTNLEKTVDGLASQLRKVPPKQNIREQLYDNTIHSVFTVNTEDYFETLNLLRQMLIALSVAEEQVGGVGVVMKRQTAEHVTAADSLANVVTEITPIVAVMQLVSHFFLKRMSLMSCPLYSEYPRLQLCALQLAQNLRFRRRQDRCYCTLRHRQARCRCRDPQ